MKWYAPVAFVAAGLLLGLAPWLREQLDFPVFYLVFLYFVFFWVAQASSWNMLTGYSGYFSFGQGAFYGVGVYTTATLVDKFDSDFLASLPLAGVNAAILGLGIGFVVFRLRKLRGELFALLTLAVALVTAAVVRNVDVIDGGYGVPLGKVPYPEFLGDFSTMMYRLGLVIALLTVFVAYAIQHSRLGQGLFAIRDDEAVAEGLGVPTFRYKMIVLAISCFFAGLSGGLHALQINYVAVDSVFNIRVPLFVILMSVLGGRRHWLGPVLGATIIHTLSDRFSSAQLEFLNQIIIGLLLIVMILFVREGIYARLQRRAGLSLGLFGTALAVQALGGIGTQLITQVAVAMLVMIASLLLPDALYRKLFGWIRVPRMARLKLRAQARPEAQPPEHRRSPDEVPEQSRIR
jgi:branched-chain amino acid transport system permease protein